MPFDMDIKLDEIIFNLKIFDKYKKFHFIQKKGYYKSSIDSLIIIEIFKNFLKKSNQKKRVNRILDIGSGAGIIPIILCKIIKNLNFQFTGIEIQKILYELSIKNSELYNVSDKIKFYNADIKKAYKKFAGQFDFIISNPPFYALDEFLISPNESLAIAKSELKLKIEDILKISKLILNKEGILCFINISNNYQRIIKTIKRYEFKILKVFKVNFLKNKNYCRIIFILKN